MPSVYDLEKYRDAYNHAAINAADMGQAIEPFPEWVAKRTQQQSPQMAFNAASGVPQTIDRSASGVSATPAADNGGFMQNMNILARILSGRR